MDPQSTIEKNFAALAGRNRQAWLETFTEDGCLFDPADAPPRCGREALGQLFDGICDAVHDMDLKIDQLWVHGAEAAVKWTIQARSAGGRACGWEGIDLFHFAPDGRIEQLSAFYDTAAVAGMLS